MNKFIFILIVQFFVGSGFAQSLVANVDTSKKGVVSDLRSSIQDEAVKNTEQFTEDKISLRQELSLERVIQASRAAKQYLKSGIDTVTLQSRLEDIKAKYIIAADDIFTNEGTIQTHRNLTATKKILLELLDELRSRKSKIDLSKRNLTDFRNRIDSLLSDSTLFIVLKDSIEFIQYTQRLGFITKEVQPVDSLLKSAIHSLDKIKNKIDYTLFEVESALDRIEESALELSKQSFDKEVNYLWESSIHSRSIEDILYNSMQKGLLTLQYYTSHNIGKILFLLILTCIGIFFIYSLKSKAREENLIQDNLTGQLVIRYPVLSAILIVFNIFQFIFPDPPFIFNCLLWIVSTTCLTIIFMNYITKYWMWFWMVMWVLFLLACGMNMILQPSNVERWLMVYIGVAGMGLGAFLLSKRHRDDLRERSIVYFIAFIVLIEALSILANMYGRFNVSKSLLTGGFINLMIAISFLWTVRLINEGLSLASQMFQSQDRRLLYINFGAIGSKAPLFLYMALVIGWFVVFARNFYEFQLLTEPISDLLHANITVGDYNFSIYNIALFALILAVSTVLSKIISFFEIESTLPSTYNGKKAGLRSWILLIRIFIIVMGLLFAFAAAGIPLDKATFVLGALGVGVGFGLQSLVQNLVSGIILIFEKPISVGDFVEIKGKTGTIKSIGFRSSVLLTMDGSNIIIPNGEILNDNVTNWTHKRDAHRRTEILVAVAYGTDLELVRRVLVDLALAEESVSKTPPPFVLISEFNESSIQFRLLFWTTTPIAGYFVKSELIIAIQEAFKTHNITIPFKQQDVHIKTFPPQQKDE